MSETRTNLSLAPTLQAALEESFTDTDEATFSIVMADTRTLGEPLDLGDWRDGQDRWEAEYWRGMGEGA